MAVAPTSLGNYMFDLAWHCHALYTIKSLEFNIQGVVSGQRITTFQSEQQLFCSESSSKSCEIARCTYYAMTGSNTSLVLPAVNAERMSSIQDNAVRNQSLTETL
jgi:hypothetical protein